MIAGRFFYSLVLYVSQNYAAINQEHTKLRSDSSITAQPSNTKLYLPNHAHVENKKKRTSPSHGIKPRIITPRWFQRFLTNELVEFKWTKTDKDGSNFFSWERYSSDTSKYEGRSGVNNPFNIRFTHAGYYIAKVKVTRGGRNVYSYPVVFQVVSRHKVPMLTFPHNSAVFRKGEPIFFEWTKVARAELYEVRFQHESGKYELIQRDILEYEEPYGLALGQYRVQARARDKFADWLPWGPSISITILDISDDDMEKLQTPPPVFKYRPIHITSPHNGSTFKTNERIDFLWTDVPYAASYEIRFNNFSLSSGRAGYTKYAASKILKPGPCTVRVRAVNVFRTIGEWSEPIHITLTQEA